ncbi:MAG: PP2C family protein-serine/threonine phosphatase [Candidatus Promineifilaceae bacterium]|nr:PP2C family protein-serine/threonine phosphatase [Candidatus Promineifilaceae bacterium]
MTDNERGEPFPPERGPADRTAREDDTWEIITAWRARAARLILAVVAVLGLPAWGSVVWNGIREGETGIVLWVYPLVYLAIIILALLPRIDHRLRIWGLLVLGYVNGCASMARLGLEGSGRLYLLVVPLFAAVLVGTRAALAITFVSIATYVLFAAQVEAGASAWMEAGIAFAAFAFTTVILVSRSSEFQIQILYREWQARRQLEAARAQLEASNRTLEEKVLKRTASLAEAKAQAEAANRRFERELQFAGRIQASFMASQLPAIPSWSSAAALVPARETSGDFYDIFPLPGDRHAILIADVVDKGVGAALFMALCWALLHTYARRYPDEPGRVLTATNRRILRDTHAGQFVTVFFGVLDTEAGTLRYANAGHPPALRLRDGSLTPLSRTGIPLGILEEEQWAQETALLEPGDLWLLYTDGVTEAQNRRGEFFEMERLVDALYRNAQATAEEIAAALLDEIETFAGGAPQADDITLLVLKQAAAVAQPA